MRTLLFLVLLLLYPLSVQAQGGTFFKHYTVLSCMEKDSNITALERDYNEQLAHQGTMRDGSLIQVYKDANGDWTMFLFLSNMPTYACLIATGQDWTEIPIGDPT